MLHLLPVVSTFACHRRLFQSRMSSIHRRINSYHNLLNSPLHADSYRIIGVSFTMHLSELHLLLSYTCTYECDHCFVHSSPEASGTMTMAQVCDAITQAAGIDTVTGVAFEGGEPFLFYPILLAGVRHARKLGLNVSVVSNGYYGISVEDAVEWLRPLAKSNVSLSLSDDDFHNPDGDADSPAAHVLTAARQLGMNVDTLCIEFDPKEMKNHVRGKPILGGGVRLRGRAAEKLIDDRLPRQPWDSFDECPDEDFVDLGRVHLDPYGNLYTCQGVVIGNLNEAPLDVILKEYDPDSQPVIGPLLRGGPAALVRAFDLPLKGEYVDACHLCYLARQMLRQQFPDHLAPAQVYGQTE
ncbi:MAG: radical SAM protein [bacterium]